MKIRRLFSVMMVVLLLISLLAGCAASSEYDSAGSAMDEGYLNRAPEAEMGMTEGIASEKENPELQAPVNQKLIRKIYIDTETEDLDPMLTQVEKKIAELGGYVESRQINNSTTRYRNGRYAELTVRIPADRLDQFVDHVTEGSNITSLRETTDDITLSYVATESRIAALETQETRLLELLAKAENMSDLLEIESKLTDVRTELSQVKSTLKVYDNQVNYGTIYLTIDEVKEYTETEEPEGFFERLWNGFVNSIKGVWTLFKELIILFIIILPYLAFFALIVAIIVLLIRLHIRRRRKKKAKKENKA